MYNNRALNSYFIQHQKEERKFSTCLLQPGSLSGCVCSAPNGMLKKMVHKTMKSNTNEARVRCALKTSN